MFPVLNSWSLLVICFKYSSVSMSVPMSVKGESSDVRGMGGKGGGKGPGWMVRVRGSEMGRLEACISILVCFFFSLLVLCDLEEAVELI